MHSNLLLNSLIFVAAINSAGATISLVSNQDIVGVGNNYSTIFFSSVTVQAGDVLVVAHSNNKNTSNNNIITLSGVGANVISSVNSGSTGTTAAAWVFYSPITVAGTFDLTLDTSNTTKTVTQSTSYFVLRPGINELLTIASADTSVATTVLPFTMIPSVTDAYGIAAASMFTSTFSANPAGWTQEIDGSSKRRTLSNADIDGTSLNSIFSATASTDMALAGIVVAASTVPEPSSALLGLGTIAVGIMRRRR
jgi:hypothetical protein